MFFVNPVIRAVNISAFDTKQQSALQQNMAQGSSFGEILKKECNKQRNTTSNSHSQRFGLYNMKATTYDLNESSSYDVKL